MIKISNNNIRINTYTICVAPHPTALAADIKPSVQREFRA